MSVSTTLTLIQIIALALPAIGIYMTLVYDTRKNLDPREFEPRVQYSPAGQSQYGHSYHGMRASVIALVFGGFGLFTHLLLILPPNLSAPLPEIPLITPFLVEWVPGLVFLFGIVPMMFGVFIFGCAVAFQQAALNDALTIRRSLEIIARDHILGVLRREEEEEEEGEG